MKTSITRKISNSGMSLIEVLAALTIGSIVTLGISNLIISAIKTQQYMLFRTAVVDKRLEILGELGEGTACTANFAGVNPTTNLPQVNTLRRANGSIFLQRFNLGAPVYSRQIQITNIYFRTTPSHSFKASGAAVNNVVEGEAELTVDFSNINPNPGGLRTISRTIKLSVTLNDTTKTIITCNSLGGGDDNLWKLNGARTYFMGNVGIRNEDPTEKLDVTGIIFTSGTASAAQRISAPAISSLGNMAANSVHSRQYMYSTSDQNLKINIENSSGLAIVQKLRGVDFDWKDSGVHSAGLIAQEVQSVLPEIVSNNAETGFYTIEYLKLVGPLIESIKELSRENKILKKRISKLEEKK